MSPNPLLLRFSWLLVQVLEQLKGNHPLPFTHESKPSTAEAFLASSSGVRAAEGRPSSARHDSGAPQQAEASHRLPD